MTTSISTKLSALGESVASWVDAQTDVARAELRGATARLFIAWIAGAIAIAGVLGLFAGLVLLLVPWLGAPASVLGVSGLALVLAAIALVTCRSGASGPTRDEAKARADAAETRLASLIAPAPQPSETQGEDPSNGGLPDPAILTSAGFALLSVLGPKRTVSLAARGAAAASAVTALAKAYHQGRTSRDKHEL